MTPQPCLLCDSNSTLTAKDFHDFWKGEPVQTHQYEDADGRKASVSSPESIAIILGRKAFLSLEFLEWCETHSMPMIIASPRIPLSFLPPVFKIDIVYAPSAQKAKDIVEIVKLIQKKRRHMDTQFGTTGRKKVYTVPELRSLGEQPVKQESAIVLVS
jgi:hypothetical protein